MAAELLRHAAADVEGLYALSEWLEAHHPGRSLSASRIHEVTALELKKISSLTTPNQVLAVVRMSNPEVDLDLLRNDYHFYLDGIRDPGNMGTILRIADWFGIHYVFCAPDCVDVYNPKVIQASMGAFLRVQAVDRPLPPLLKSLPGLPVLGAVLDGEDVFETALPGSGIIVIGGEAQGITSEVLALLTHRLRIPAGPGSGAESLNAAVATGIISAVLRHRQLQEERE